jgi:hypothetical protein
VIKLLGIRAADDAVGPAVGKDADPKRPVAGCGRPQATTVQCFARFGADGGSGCWAACVGVTSTSRVSLTLEKRGPDAVGRFTDYK